MPADAKGRQRAGAAAVLLAALVAAPVELHAGDANAAARADAAAAWPTVGRGTMRYFGLAIYEATLSSPERLSADRWPTQPLALTLVYRRQLGGAAIAERSLLEMRRGGPVDEARAEAWLAFMRAAFPDVQAGDRIVGEWRPVEGKVVFRAPGGAVHERVDAEFGRRFFGIWLAPHTSEPGLRASLLALP